MSQKGFIYEDKTWAFLLKTNRTTRSDRPAGASSDKPDLIIKIGDKTTKLGNGKHGVELKTDLASAGSLVFHYNRKNNKFEWGDTGGNKEKVFLKELGDSKRIMPTINRTWHPNEPYNQANRDQQWLDWYGNVPLFERYQSDLENFRDIIKPVPPDTIEKYYNLKDTNYLNIGSHGFYLLGASDPAGLNDRIAHMNKRRKKQMPPIPRWNVSNRTQLRCRVQIKGSRSAMKAKGTKDPMGGQGYQFTFELQFQGVTSSPYNIAPIASMTKTTVLLSEKNAVFPW